MNDNLHPLFQQILKPYMPAEDRAADLINQMLKNNDTLLKQVSELKPEDQKIYLPKVSAMIASTHQIVTTLNKKG